LTGSLPITDLPSLTLVIGGARSGKSAFGERLITATPRLRRYIATASAWDDEMRDRIARHQRDRTGNWTTVEAPLELSSALAAAPTGEAVLIDCATLWLTNLLLADHDIPAETDRLVASIAACPAPVVIVSNEVGYGIVPENSLARRFRDEQGRLNQRLALEADVVVNVIAGLPLVLKGCLP
jgi:adenosylcobinamide kinase / adenosylcobinamide-phosphate guanylyltransferase